MLYIYTRQNKPYSIHFTALAPCTYNKPILTNIHNIYISIYTSPFKGPNHLKQKIPYSPSG